MNQTIQAFGYPETVIKEYDHWVVMLRPQQVTIGSLVLASKSEETNLGTLSDEEWKEFSQVTQETEELLRTKFGAEKFNYLALMMVDPNVHFHFVPRYSKPVVLGDKEYPDVDWPSKTELKPLGLTAEEFELVKSQLVG